MMKCDMEIHNLFQHHAVAFDERATLRWNIGTCAVFFLFARHRFEQARPQILCSSQEFVKFKVLLR